MKKVAGLMLAVALVAGIISCSKDPDIADPFAQLSKDTAAIRTYLMQNGISATKIAYGVWFSVDKSAKGMRANYQDTMLMTYTMRLMTDGSIVDQSSSSVSFSLASLITGIQVAMPFFQKGNKGKIFIPSSYGYGAVGQGKVPANSNLIFEFELLDIKNYQLRKDTAAVAKYIRDNSIANVKRDTSGMRYVINSIGTGSTVSLTDSVKVNLVGKLIANPPVIAFQTASPTNYAVSTLLPSMRIALVETGLREGGEITVYSPSGLAFGPTANTIAPANSNMIFNIQLVKIVPH